MWNVCLHQSFFLFHPPAAEKCRHPVHPKEVVPGAKGRHTAKGVKVAMDEKVRRSKVCALQTAIENLSREHCTTSRITPDDMSL